MTETPDGAAPEPGAPAGRVMQARPEAVTREGTFNDERSLAAFLLVDVAGYSRPMGGDEKVLLRRIESALGAASRSFGEI